MPALTDAAIKAAIRKAEATAKPLTLSDGEGKGTGRLKLTVRPMPTRTLAEWYAVSWRCGKRTQAKIGAYPSLSLKEARERFSQRYAGAIQKGASIKTTADDRPGTVADLVAAYCDHLQAAGKPSYADVRKALNKAADTIGRNRPARDIAPDDITGLLAPIYQRGAPSMADHLRSYLRAAFGWGLKSDNDYRSPNKQRRFKLERNPAADIPTEPKRVGTRWLDKAEFVEVFRWLERPDSTVTPRYMQAIQLIMLTGQRVREIASLKADQWDATEKTLTWPKTKNGKPHCLPVCDMAAEILNNLTPGKGGWLFPSAMDTGKPVTEESLYCTIWRCRSRMTVQPFALRDLRRTWKTLAGEAGLTKHERDLLQNHARHDVSSRHYDRWEYMPEKRAAVEKWNSWIASIIHD